MVVYAPTAKDQPNRSLGKKETNQRQKNAEKHRLVMLNGAIHDGANDETNAYVSENT